MLPNPDSTKVGASAVVSGNSSTQLFTYPAGTGPASFGQDGNHQVLLDSVGVVRSQQGHATFSFLPSGISVTLNNGKMFLDGTTARIKLDIAGHYYADDQPDDERGIFNVQTARVYLGAPAAADADGVCASQAGTAATAMTINGALASGGVATFDKPRNVVAAWTNTATITITGTDEYGNVLVETSASGTSHTGKKAFKTITSVVPSANITGATVGTGVVLGLPVFLGGAGYILKEIMDGAAATAGTTVAGVTATASATTGDVRGTYSPNSAPNGTRIYELILALESFTFRGVAQYAG